MLMIRLQRIGRKNQAAFRVRVVDSHRAAKAGTSVEILGSYSPHTNLFEVNKERALYWIGKGAQVSDTVRNLLIANGVLQGKKVNVLPKKAPLKKDQPEQAAGVGAETAAPAAETASEGAAAEEASAPEAEVKTQEPSAAA